MSDKSKLKRNLTIAGASGFVIAVVAVTIGLIVGPGNEPQPAAQPPKSTETEESVAVEPQPTKQLDGFEGVDRVKLDDTGMAQMQVTTDPRIAAASAAQVLTSVDTGKITWPEDFREEAVSRVMRPSPEYVGAGDSLVVTDMYGESKNGEDLINNTAQMIEPLEYSPEGWWWMLGDARQFQGYASYGAVLQSKAIEVYNQAEMTEYSDGASWTEPSSSITLNVDPEASFELYWVRVETETKTGDSVTSARYPVAVSVYCDPPAKGGVCGVASLQTKYPSGWKTNY